MTIYMVPKRKLVVLLLLPVLAVYCVFHVLIGNAISSFNPEKEVTLPIIMYHSLLKDLSRSGKYVLPPELLRKDMEYLKDKGYQTVTMTQVIAYVSGQDVLPEKPIVISFDDGFYNNLTYLIPILEEFDARAVLSAVGEYADLTEKSNDKNPNYAYLGWDDLEELNKNGHIEIQNHSYYFHSESIRLRAKIQSSGNAEAYAQAVVNDALLMQDMLRQKCQVISTVYTYPHGDIGSSCDKALKEAGFLATLSCRQQINYLSHDPDCLYSLGRYNRPSELSSEAFFNQIIKD